MDNERLQVGPPQPLFLPGLAAVYLAAVSMYLSSITVSNYVEVSFRFCSVLLGVPVVYNSCVWVSLMLKCCENQIFMEKTRITSHRVDRSCLSWNHGPTDTGPAQCSVRHSLYSCTVQCAAVQILH